MKKETQLKLHLMKKET